MVHKKKFYTKFYRKSFYQYLQINYLSYTSLLLKQNQGQVLLFPINRRLKMHANNKTILRLRSLNCLFPYHSLGMVSIKQVVNVGERSFLAKHHRAITSSKHQTLLPAIYVNRSQATLFKPNHNPSK